MDIYGAPYAFECIQMDTPQMARIHLLNHVIRTYGLGGKRNNWSFPCVYSLRKMPHFCAVPGCSKRSDRDSQVSYHCLPLKNKLLLKQWIHKSVERIYHSMIPRAQQQFVHSRGRMLHSDKVPSLKLPVLPTQAALSRPRRLLT